MSKNKYCYIETADMPSVLDWSLGKKEKEKQAIFFSFIFTRWKTCFYVVLAYFSEWNIFDFFKML